MLGLTKSKKETTKTRILVIDDEPDVVKMVQYRLNSFGFEVVAATNWEEGLEKAANEKPDLILLDINMPVVDGFGILERLRNHPDLKNTPVIILTACSERSDVVKATSLGIADYITKPFDCAELSEKITNALENKTNSK